MDPAYRRSQSQCRTLLAGPLLLHNLSANVWRFSLACGKTNRVSLQRQHQSQGVAAFVLTLFHWVMLCIQSTKSTTLQQMSLSPCPELLKCSCLQCSVTPMIPRNRLMMSFPRAVSSTSPLSIRKGSESGLLRGESPKEPPSWSSKFEMLFQAINVN